MSLGEYHMRFIISAFAIATAGLVSTAEVAVAQRSWEQCFQIARARGFSVSEYDTGRNSGRSFMNACMQGGSLAAAAAATHRQKQQQQQPQQWGQGVGGRSWEECFQIARARGFSVSEYDTGRNSGRGFMNSCMQGQR